MTISFANTDEDLSMFSGVSFSSAALASFSFTVKTDNTGTSNNDQFTIPLYSGETYDFTVTYDGQTTTHNTDVDLTLTFPSGAGTYPVQITGTFAGIYFNNSGDKFKITEEVSSFGDLGWCRLDSAFFGCGNITNFLGTIPYNAGITSLASAWFNCSKALSFPNVSLLTNIISLSNTWNGNTLALSFPNINTLTSVTGMDSAWGNAKVCEVFPSVSNLINSATIRNAWYGCDAMTTVPELMTASTALTNCSGSFTNVGSGMGGTIEELWNAGNFPNVSLFAGFATGATGLTNYADIPDAWKGL